MPTAYPIEPTLGEVAFLTGAGCSFWLRYYSYLGVSNAYYEDGYIPVITH